MKIVDIRPLKSLARKLPDCALRTVLLAEEDEIDVVRFLALLPLWLRLARLVDEESMLETVKRRCR